MQPGPRAGGSREADALRVEIEIPGWHPVTNNKLLGTHPKARGKLKAADSWTVAACLMAARVPKAEAKRRVELTIILRPGQRGADVDAYWKSLLDALVNAGALVDDNRHWCEYRTPAYERGTAREWGTRIVLEDVA